jgi:toxin ParE1/3/4
MNRRIFERTRARRDLANQARFISHDNRRAAERLLESYEETVRRIASTPTLGTPWEFKKPKKKLFWWPIDGFPNHIILFDQDNDHVEVIRVLQTSRDLNSLLG